MAPVVVGFGSFRKKTHLTLNGGGGRSAAELHLRLVNRLRNHPTPLPSTSLSYSLSSVGSGGGGDGGKFYSDGSESESGDEGSGPRNGSASPQSSLYHPLSKQRHAYSIREKQTKKKGTCVSPESPCVLAKRCLPCAACQNKDLVWIKWSPVPEGDRGRDRHVVVRDWPVVGPMAISSVSSEGEQAGSQRKRARYTNSDTDNNTDDEDVGSRKQLSQKVDAFATDNMSFAHLFTQDGDSNSESEAGEPEVTTTLSHSSGEYRSARRPEHVTGHQRGSPIATQAGLKKKTKRTRKQHTPTTSKTVWRNWLLRHGQICEADSAILPLAGSSTAASCPSSFCFAVEAWVPDFGPETTASPASARVVPVDCVTSSRARSVLRSRVVPRMCLGSELGGVSLYALDLLLRRTFSGWEFLVTSLANSFQSSGTVPLLQHGVLHHDIMQTLERNQATPTWNQASAVTAAWCRFVWQTQKTAAGSMCVWVALRATVIRFYQEGSLSEDWLVVHGGVEVTEKKGGIVLTASERSQLDRLSRLDLEYVVPWLAGGESGQGKYCVFQAQLDIVTSTTQSELKPRGSPHASATTPSPTSPESTSSSVLSPPLSVNTGSQKKTGRRDAMDFNRRQRLVETPELLPLVGVTLADGRCVAALQHWLQFLRYKDSIAWLQEFDQGLDEQFFGYFSSLQYRDPTYPKGWTRCWNRVLHTVLKFLEPEGTQL
jgi:hypothetical protein